MQDTPVLDQEIFTSVVEMIGEDNRQMLVDKFVNSSNECLQKIQQGVSTQDADAVRAGAHSLKSSSAQIGGMQLSALAANIEQKAREGDLSDMAGLSSALNSAFAALEESFS